MRRNTGKTRARNLSDRLEALWEDLLSRSPERVKTAFATLDPAERKVVLEHLHKMAGEAGWQPEQRWSAQAALQILELKPE